MLVSELSIELSIPVSRAGTWEEAAELSVDDVLDDEDDEDDGTAGTSSTFLGCVITGATSFFASSVGAGGGASVPQVPGTIPSRSDEHRCGATQSLGE